MADIAPGKDRFSIPDSASMLRGASEEGVTGRHDSVFHSEELDSGHSKAAFKGDRLTGGGEGGLDRLFSDPWNSDPELLSLYKDYVKDQRLPMYLDDDRRTLLSLVPRNMDETEAKAKFALWLSKDEEKSKVVVAHPKPRFVEKAGPETKVDTKGFNLVLYQPALDRLTEGAEGELAKSEAERNKGAVKDFWGIWTHGPNEIKAIGFGVDERKTKVTTVIMRLKDGTSVTIPSHVFRRVFDVRNHEGKNGVSGLEFVGGSSLRGFIDPFTPVYKLKEIMSKVNMNGVKLNPDVRFFIGPYEKLKRTHAPRFEKSPVEVKV